MSEDILKKTILTVLIAFGVCYGVYEYFIVFRNEAIENLSQEYKVKHERIKRLEELSDKKKMVEKKIKDYEKEIEALENIVPVESSNEDFTLEMYSIIKSDRIKADNFELSSPEEESKFNVTRLTVEKRGTIDEIENTINYFKNLKKKVFIKNFSMQAESESYYSAIFNVERYSIKKQ